MIAATILIGCSSARPARIPLAPVPADPPDSTPDSVWKEVSKPENVLFSPPSVSGRVLWNTLYVKFRPSATQPQKQAILDSVPAVVIGGLRIGTPSYYHIRLIAGRPTAPDSSSGPLLRARRFLENSPLVGNVLFDQLDPISPLKRPR